MKTIPIKVCGFWFVIGQLFWLAASGIWAQTEIAWPMAGANPQRTSWTPEEVSNFNLLWYRPIEPYIAPYVQIVAANNTLFVSTAKGLLALNPSTGATKWTMETELPLGNAPTIHNGIAYVGGFDRRLYAVDINTGSVLWSFDGAGAGYDTNPLVANNLVYVGNRDGYLYAVYAHETNQRGQLAWKFKTDGPIPYSAALSTNGQTLYFASNDGHGYAVNALYGQQVWKSPLLPGLGFRNWWPVVYQDKVIMVGTTPYRTIGPGPGQDLQNLDAEDLFYTSKFNSANPGQSIAEYLKSQPYRRTTFVLNAADGSEYTYGNGYYAPFAWFGTRAGSRYPPIIMNNTIYQANNYTANASMWSSRGQIVGWQLGSTTITMPAPRTNASDEPLAYSAGGNTIYWNLCCDREAGWFSPGGGSGTLWSYNLDTRAPGYDEVYWGQAESGLNKLYGNANGVYGSHGDNNAFIPYQQKLFVHRSNAILAFGSGASSGKVARATIIGKSTNVPTSLDLLKTKLEAEVNKMINAGHLRPAYSISGNVDGGMYRIYGERFLDNFHNAAETLAVLGRAYSYVSATTQTKLRTYLQAEFAYVGTEHVGWNSGAAREPYTLPPDVTNAFASFTQRDDGTAYRLFRNYGLWQYAKATGQNSAAFSAADGRPTSATSFSYPFQHNAAIAGTKGYLELAKLVGNTTEVNWAQSVLNNQLAARAANFNKNLGDASDTANNYSHTMAVASNFMFMTPVLGDYLAANAQAKVQPALDEYLRIAPYWFVSRFGATYGEGAIQPLMDYEALFQAKAYFQKQSREELAKFIDVPATAIGDLYYINNLVAAIDAPSNGTPPATPLPTPQPTPVIKPGDANGDNRVDGVDYMVWRNHYNQNISGRQNGDFDGSGKVDGVDYMIWRNNYGK